MPLECVYVMLSARSNRPICCVSPVAKSLIAILVLAPTTSCWLGDSALGPDGRVVQLTLVTAFSTHELGPPAAVGPLAEVTSLGFIVRRMDGLLVVADTVPVDIESRRVEYLVEVTYTPPMETFTVEFVLLDSNGDELFTGGPIEYTVSEDEPSTSPVEVPVVYVGTTGIVRGSVSAEGTGLDGVTVTLVGDLSLTTTTAGGGAYTFLDVWAGTYSVEVSDFPPDVVFPTTPSVATIDSDGQVVVVDFYELLTVTTTSLVDGVLNFAYGETVEATGGDGSHTWSLATGSLPVGLSHDPSTGEVSGTPIVPGIQDFTLEVASGDGQTVQQALSITILAVRPVLQPGDLCSDHPAVSIATFEDAILEGAVRDSLGVGAQDDLTCQLLSTLTSLAAGNVGIASLVGIQNLTSLTSLELGSNQAISDINPLSGLTNLTVLRLDRNHLITDISALSGLTNLTRLGLDNSDGFGSITDISVLSGMTNLTNLGIRGNTITDISPLAGLTSLTRLNLANNSITDISPLSGLTNLTFLAINDNQLISDISPLAGLTNLTSSLWIGINQITDISPLSGMTKLTRLLAWDNLITDLTVLQGLTNLTQIVLHGNARLADVQPLLDNTGLAGASVSLAGTSVSCSDAALLSASTDFCPPLPTQSVFVLDNWFGSRGESVAVGGTVTWTWGGQNAHNVTFSSGPNSPTQVSGTFARVFTTAGLYDYECTIHGPAMSGTILVK